MIGNTGYIKNPLTVIAMFAGIAEISGVVVLPLLEFQIQQIFVWFLMAFPTLLVIAFFSVLLLDHKVLYAPSDYKDENNFVGGLRKKTLEDVQAEDREKKQEEGIQTTKIQDMSSILKQRRELEKNALQKFSNQSQINLETEYVVLDNSNRRLLFDAVSLERGRVKDVVEAKIVSNNSIFYIGSLERIFYRTELLFNQESVLDKSNFKFHLLLILSGNKTSKNKIMEKIQHFISQFSFPVEIHFYTEKDLLQSNK